MNRSLLPILSALSLYALALPASPAHAQISSLPKLGAPAPASLFAEKHDKDCRTDVTHRDPCADVQIGGVRYTIAWDAQTKTVTWLFTDDHHILTDEGLSVGDTCRVVLDSGQPDPTVSYMKWMIDPKWRGTDAKSGAAVWYAVLHKDDYDHHFGDIVGFVQSRYIQLSPGPPSP